MIERASSSGDNRVSFPDFYSIITGKLYNQDNRDDTDRMWNNSGCEEKIGLKIRLLKVKSIWENKFNCKIFYILFFSFDGIFLLLFGIIIDI